MRQSFPTALLLALAILGLTPPPAGASMWEEQEEREVPAGTSFTFQFNPADEIYGISAGYGLYVVDTPFFGDYFLTLFNNELEQAFYTGLGMTVRVMPHWKVAPFVGGGGSYNFSLSSGNNDSSIVIDNGQATLEETNPRGESYWGGHVETGVRFRFASRIQLLELSGRYTWSSAEGDVNYWLVGISVGAGI
jgi:hypothetical protein